jgi:hypothetical protein
MPNMPVVSVDLEEEIGSADENEGHRCYGLTRPVFHVSRIQRLLARVERFFPAGVEVLEGLRTEYFRRKGSLNG